MNGDLAPKETVNPDLKRAINKALRSKRLGTRLEGVVARIVEMASYDITEFQKDVYGPIGTVTDIDVGVPGVIVEVKSGKTWDSKATEKLEIKLGEGPDGALVNPDKKPVIVYAPEMPPEKVEWIKNTGERVHVAQNPEQYINLLKLLNRK
jgi:Uma2 family endonuclease